MANLTKNDKAKKWLNQIPPREKLLLHGAQTLTDSELLAIFLRTGLPSLPVLAFSQALIDSFGSLYDLINADHATFSATKGLGTSKYTQLQAISELAKRIYAHQVTQFGVLSDPQVTYQYLQMLIGRQEREVFVVLFLDNQHRVINQQEMFKGTIDGVAVHPREIVREALRVNAAAIILAHNHPSGVAEPSKADRIVTKEIVKSCALLEIKVLDHLVIGKGEFVSFAERDWL
jgi:DNA repair protein RadC